MVFVVMCAMLVIAMTHHAFMTMHHFLVLMVAAFMMAGESDDLIEGLALIGCQD